MMESYNLILNQDDARRKVKEGINKATELVAPTLGATSRRILLDKEYGEMNACDDGTTILNDISIEDTQINMGIKVVREASGKTNVDEGDGTTTTAVILNALVNKLLAETKESKDDELDFTKGSKNNLKLRQDIKVGLEKVINYINENKIEVTTKEQIAQIGRVSANSQEIGDLLADMFEKLGKEGAIAVEEGKSVSTEYEIIPGMSSGNGWVAQEFVTNVKTEEAILDGEEKPISVLVSTTKIVNADQVKKLVELFEGGATNLLIIADDISGAPLQSLVINKMRQVLKVVAVKAPQVGNQAEFLRDICAVTGAQLVGPGGDTTFENMSIANLGKAKKAIVTNNKTIIIGLGDNAQIEERVAVLNNRLEKEESDYEAKTLKERISKLRGGVGNIKVGGSTPLEIKDKKTKVVDAVSAVKSALLGGVVDGGGIALLGAAQILDDNIEGEKVLKSAIQVPFELIMANADINKGPVKEKYLETGEGLNVETGETGNLIEMGIIDPANVVKAALTNAVSNALMVSNLGGAVALVRSDDKEDDIKM